jgi:hypothetical protein
MGIFKMKTYRRLTKTLQDPGKFIPSGEVENLKFQDDKDYYLSIYEYDEKQNELFLKNRNR